MKKLSKRKSKKIEDALTKKVNKYKKLLPYRVMTYRPNSRGEGYTYRAFNTIAECKKYVNKKYIATLNHRVSERHIAISKVNVMKSVEKGYMYTDIIYKGTFHIRIDWKHV